MCEKQIIGSQEVMVIGRETEWQTPWAIHRITMDSPPQSSVANAKIPHGGRHINTHTQTVYTAAWSHAYRWIQFHIQDNILVSQGTWSVLFTPPYPGLYTVSGRSGYSRVNRITTHCSAVITIINLAYGIICCVDNKWVIFNSTNQRNYIFLSKNDSLY